MQTHKHTIPESDNSLNGIGRKITVAVGDISLPENKKKAKIIRTYKLQSGANKAKQEKVVAVVLEYRKTCTDIARLQWRLFFQHTPNVLSKEKQKAIAEGKDIKLQYGFDKNAEVKQVPSLLSLRYKRNACYQVVGSLQSFISNRQNDFIMMVYHSTVDESTRKHLFQINKRELWFVKQHELFTADELFLARKIFKHILSKHHKPTFRNESPLLNANVAKITVSNKGEFDYWVRFSTLQKRKPVMLPIRSNDYFISKGGELQQCVQVIYKKDKKLEIGFMKDIPPTPYKSLTDIIGIDIGLRELFTVSDLNDKSSYFGRNLIDRLKYYDAIITELRANLQRQGIKPSESTRHNELVSTIRSFLKNEIRRCLNRIVKIYSPKHIVIERLDFREQDLSKWMNRLLCNFGKSAIIAKLDALKQERGITYEEINPAYTSQECNRCHHVSKANRKTQKIFQCTECTYTINADVSGSRNVLSRSSDSEISIYTGRDKVLQILTKRYLEQHTRHNSLANGSTTNPSGQSRKSFVNTMKYYET